MASLTGQTISTTYDSLLKLTDNGPITASFKEITDGLGNSSGIFVKSTGQIKLGNYTTTTSFTGTAAGYLAFTSAGEIITTAIPSGGITSLNALTASTQTFAVGTSGTDFAISSATSTHTFNLPTASGTNRGALSSADWTTFNNKQNALTNPVTGTGTTNYVPKFSGSTSIANSLVYDTGTAIGIGTTSPSATLDVYRASGETTLQISAGSEYARLFYRDSDDNFGMFINGLTRWRFIGASGGCALLENGNGNVAIGTTIATATTKLWVAGTGYFSGSLGIGATALTDSALRISKTITGSTTASGILITAPIQTDVTSTATMFQSTPTQVAGGTLTTLYHFAASQSTLSGSVTTQIGYQVYASVSGATNNRAFQGQIAAATNNYNLYMAGTAQNYLAGNLGIGTISPSLPLHVYNSAAALAYFESTNANGAYTIWRNSSNNFGDVGSALGISGSGSASDFMVASRAGSMILGTSSAERMRITSAGNVGIGTTSPTKKLHVSGQSFLDGNVFVGTNGGTFFSGDGSFGAGIYGANSGLDVVLQSNSAERMRINSTGNVGIGTSSPNEKLSVIGAISANNGMIVQGYSAAASGLNCEMGVNSGYVQFNSFNRTTAAYASLRLDGSNIALNNGSGGNVGIGTATPSYQLQLSTDSAAKPTSALWTIASDSRIKENITPYSKGLKELMLINPINYDYNGLGGFKKGKGGVGIIAQEILNILPDSVSSVKGKLNEGDKEETDILNFNGHELTYVLINAIKEQQAQIEELKLLIKK